MWKLASLRLTLFFLVVVALTGCLYTSDSQLITPDERTTPLDPGVYYQTSILKPGKSMQKNWQNEFTTHELKIISAELYIPNIEGKGDLRIDDDCYYLDSGGDKGDGVFLQHIKGDYYILEATEESCATQKQDVENGFTYLVAKVDRHNRFFTLSHPDRNAFTDWLNKLEKSKKEELGVVHGNVLSGTKALVEFYQEHQDELKQKLILVPVSKASIYKEEMSIAARINQLSKS